MILRSFEGPVVSREHRPDRRIEHGRDLFEGHSADVTHVDNFAVCTFKLAQGLAVV